MPGLTHPASLCLPPLSTAQREEGGVPPLLYPIEKGVMMPKIVGDF